MDTYLDIDFMHDKLNLIKYDIYILNISHCLFVEKTILFKLFYQYLLMKSYSNKHSYFKILSIRTSSAKISTNPTMN